jgi:DAK2 domain fusion protein YloV
MGGYGDRKSGNLDAMAFRAWLFRARNEITRSRQRLNGENLYPVADADTGSNMEATIRAAADALARESSDQLHLIADAAAQGALRGAQGNSGVLLSQILRGFADGIRKNLPEAFSLAHERALKAVADPKEGTILSVVRAARDAAVNVTQWSSEVKRDGEIALAAWKAARSSTLDSANNPPIEAARGTIDAGAHGIELIYRALVAVLDGNTDALNDLPVGDEQLSAHVDLIRNGDGAYEVMYQLSGVTEAKIEVLRNNLSEIGQSLLIVGDTKYWKVHVHTDFAQEAVELAQAIGSPENIRVTALVVGECGNEPRLVTVANGPGFEALMRESGVKVIGAFNSRRVSPEEWISAAESSTEVILIPHDFHGHQSAEIAAAGLIKSGKRVAVIASYSPLQALAAISTNSENIESDFDSEVATMSEASARTISITIAVAPRDMNLGAEVIPAGAVIALKERNIIASGDDVVEVAHQAIKLSTQKKTELVTLVIGAESYDGIAAALEERIHQTLPSVEVTTYLGGQAWYPLLIGIE